jgi:thiol-disulfide isomerase/thioredoxin
LVRFLGLYYVASAALILCYFANRYFYPDQYNATLLRKFNDMAFFENAVWMMVFAPVITQQLGKFISVDSLLASVLTRCKAVTIVLALMKDWRMGTFFLVAFMLVFVLFPQPIYKGSSKVQDLTPAFFQQLVQEGGPGDETWLVEFMAPWSSACVHFAPVFARLSEKYTTDDLSFGRLEVSRWPHLAQTLNIDIGSSSPQLPTVIIFKEGKEVGRMPHVGDNDVVAQWKGTEKSLVDGFELAKQYA